ncbi:MAG: HD domain-containing protein [Chloroflexi bacterium]|nr:HD domain-containing protein [Chloroflexota bacterium]
MSNQICKWCGEPISWRQFARISNAEFCLYCQTALPQGQRATWAPQGLFRAFPAETDFAYRFANLVALHTRFAPTSRTLSLVWHHSMIVALIAIQLHRRTAPDLDEKVIWQAALVHDLGIYRTIDWDDRFAAEMSCYIRHGIIGGHILRREGFPEEIARVAERHTGVGITREDIARQALPLPSEDYVPQSRLEELICYADKFHSKRLKFSTFDEALAVERARGTDKEQRLLEFKDKFGLPKLEFIRSVYEPWQRAFGATQNL